MTALARSAATENKHILSSEETSNINKSTTV
jgi:hypothetical protein